jgi:hypothetical protein
MYVTMQPRRRGRLGENIAVDFQNTQALNAMQTAVPPPIQTNTPFLPTGDNPLNWPGDTPLSADPNAPAILAAQAITNPPGSWASSTGNGYGYGTPTPQPPQPFSLSAIPWWAWALAALTGVLIAVKR